MADVLKAAKHALLQARITIASHKLDKAVKRLESAELDARYHKHEVERIAAEIVANGYRHEVSEP